MKISVKAFLIFCLLVPVLTLFGGCAPEEYSVTLDYGYRDWREELTVTEGLLTPPEEPSRAGYSFLGWYEEEREWQFDTDVLTQDMTLVARWEPQRYTVTLYIDQESGETQTLSVAYGEEYTLPEPTKEGSYFAGWAFYWTGPKHKDAGTWVMDPPQDQRLYARWLSYPPGMTVTLGHYEQNNDLEDGPEPIEWLVLDHRDGAYRLISKYVLDARSYDYNHESKWADCDLRAWLGNEFFHTAFSETEKGYLKEVYDDYAKTTDTVSVLNLKEAKTLFYEPDDLFGRCTPYCLATGVQLTSRHTVFGWGVYWWLRTNRANTNKLSAGLMAGAMCLSASNVSRGLQGVRPTVWVSEEILTIKNPSMVE